jgi:myo-inositol catabolism protein IolC
VGRTVFWKPLIDWRAGKASCEQAVERIAGRYREFVALFEEG